MDNPLKRSRTMNYFESSPIEKKELEKIAAEKKALAAEKEALAALERKTKPKVQAPKKGETKTSVQASDPEKTSVVIGKKEMPKKESQNGSHKEDEKIHKSRRIKKALIFGSAGVFVALLLIGGCFGLEMYETYLRKVAVEKVVKGDVSVVLHLNTSAKFEQYKFLDDHIKKFPGYSLLEKELDDVGEGKSPSQFIHDKLRENNLSFEEDIQTVIGDDFYVLIPDLSNLEKSVQHKMSYVKDKSFAVLDRDSDGSKVLGMTTDYYANANPSPEIEPIDFIMASPIKDLKEAKRVLDKIKSNKEAYEMEEKKFNGYYYFKIGKVGYERDDLVPFDIGQTYHALLGGNWVMSTNEEYMKEMISKRKSEHLFYSLRGPLNNKDEKKAVTLAENKDFSTVLSEIKTEKEKSIITGYFKVNFNRFFGMTQSTEAKYFKYPEKFTGGFMFKVEKEGIAFRSVSNQISLERTENVPYGNGLVEKVPAMVDGRFTDIYLESANVKDIYYSFKRNNLTKEGLDEWEGARKEINNAVGIDFERDIVDQLTGNVAAAAFTKRGLEPEEAFIVEIADKERVVESARKIIEMVKTTYLGMASMGGSAMMYDSRGISMDEEAMLEQNEAQKQQLEAIANSQITETQTENGTIYSYKFPGTEFSFDFGFHENTLVLGSHYAAVTGLLAEFSGNVAPKLSSAEGYNASASYLFPEGYSKMYMNTFGLWNAIDYYVNHFGVVQAQEEKDIFFAVGAILRTFNIVGSVDAISNDGKSAKSSIYLNIKELPAEEKARAEKVLSSNMGSHNSARDRARMASLQATLSAATTIASLCVNDGGNVMAPLSATTGTGDICSNTAITSEAWPTLTGSGVGYQYGVTNNTLIEVTDGSNAVVTCTIATGSCVRN